MTRILIFSNVIANRLSSFDFWIVVHWPRLISNETRSQKLLVANSIVKFAIVNTFTSTVEFARACSNTTVKLPDRKLKWSSVAARKIASIGANDFDSVISTVERHNKGAGDFKPHHS